MSSFVKGGMLNALGSIFISSTDGLRTSSHHVPLRWSKSSAYVSPGLTRSHHSSAWLVSSMPGVKNAKRSCLRSPREDLGLVSGVFATDEELDNFGKRDWA